ncbi:MAG: SURF1 family cytochrome oxidase biogenesis protein, partial [Pseudolabrys sp.]
MSKGRRKRKSGVLDATLLAFAGIAILIGLGVWQLDRKTWKENLIATLNTRLGHAPEDLPPRSSWPQLREDGQEFRRVAFPAEFLDGEEALVYTAGSPLRPDVKGPGYWVFAPARLAGGSI